MDLRTEYWNLIIVDPLQRGIQFLASDLGLGAGLAIILFTILVKLILIPLTLQSLRSQREMQKIQPEIKALQQQFGKDKEKLSAATMALYKDHGINPAAGCLPLLLQMPVLFGLYGAFSNLQGVANSPFQQPWLWVPRIDQPDVITVFGTNLPFILPVLAAATQWVQQRMAMPQTDDPQQKLQNSMMQFMPLMMLWFGLQFSAGLALYWVTQNIFGIVQQYFISGWGSLLPNRAPAALPAGDAPKNGNGRSPAVARNGRAFPRGTRTGTGVASDEADGASGSQGEGNRRKNRNNRAAGGAPTDGSAKGQGRRAGGKR